MDISSTLTVKVSEFSVSSEITYGEHLRAAWSNILIFHQFLAVVPTVQYVVHMIAKVV